MLERMWRNRNTFTCWWECKLVQPLWKTVWRFLKDLEIEIPFDPAIPLLGITQRITNHSIIRMHAQYVHRGTVYNSKDLEPTQMHINDRLDKENVAHIHHGILCSHKKWWVWVLNRDMTTIILSKVTQEKKIKHCMFSLIGRCWRVRTHGRRVGASHTGVCWGREEEGQQGVGRLGRDNMVRNQI